MRPGAAEVRRLQDHELRITGGIALTGACVMLYAQHRLASRKPEDEFDDLPVDGDVALVAQSNETGTRP